MDWDTLLCEDRIRSFVRKAGASDLRSEFEKDITGLSGALRFGGFRIRPRCFLWTEVILSERG